MKLHVYIHPDACHGKSCVDAHLTVSYRHLKRYINETRFDVLTPEDIVDALTYDGGVKNTAVEYISINRKYVDLNKYELSSELKLIANMETPCEVRYEHIGGEKYSAHVYKYSNCCFKSLFIYGHESHIIYDYVHDSPDDEETNSSKEEGMDGKANNGSKGKGSGKKKKASIAAETT